MVMQIKLIVVVVAIPSRHHRDRQDEKYLVGLWGMGTLGIDRLSHSEADEVIRLGSVSNVSKRRSRRATTVPKSIHILI